MEDRKIYIDKMAAKLKEWDTDIQKLEAKADVAKVDVEAGYRQQIDELRSKKEEAQQKLNKIKEAQEDAWEDLKAGFESSWKMMNDSIKSALGKFKE